MPAYDSDSSSDGGDGYTTTNVILGYATTDSTGDEISHIGGHPIWLDERHPPPSALARCKVCNGYMSLLLQLNADLQQHFPNDQRRLHVLCCRRKACNKKGGSIRAFREVKKYKDTRKSAKAASAVATPATSPQSKEDLGSALFGRSSAQSTSNNANPFSMSKSPSQTTSSNPFSSRSGFSELAAKPPQQPTDEAQSFSTSFADKLKISLPTLESSPVAQDPWPETSSFPPPFTSFYLDAHPEELESENPSQQAAPDPSKTKYDIEDSTTLNTLDKDTFESSLDKTFQKFSDRVAQNPEQVLRYEYKGQPLLYSGAENVSSCFIVLHGRPGPVRGLPRCEVCGAQRVFEMQLMPGLIYELEKDEALDLDDGMEWGTAIVGSCSSNCGESGSVSFREEWVGVQWEERVASR